MILSLLSFPSPPSALCTVFSERSLPCPVISPCSSLSLCPVPSGPSLFFLSWGALGGGGACCCGEGVAKGAGQGEQEGVRSNWFSYFLSYLFPHLLPPLFHSLSVCPVECASPICPVFPHPCRCVPLLWCLRLTPWETTFVAVWPRTPLSCWPSSRSVGGLSSCGQGVSNPKKCGENCGAVYTCPPTLGRGSMAAGVAAH